MALIIESGSVVTGANSWASVAEARAYAAARASTLPVADADVEAALIKGADYLETFRDQFKGSKVSPGVQTLQWPRKDVHIEGYDLPETSIPVELKNAQIELAITSAAGTDLMPTGDGREVIREKLDVLETEYSPGNGGSPQPQFPKVRALLAPLLKSGGLLRVTRF